MMVNFLLSDVKKCMQLNNDLIKPFGELSMCGMLNETSAQLISILARQIARSGSESLH
jgi:hypothetical protein